jgi:hypothetical protein
MTIERDPGQVRRLIKRKPEGPFRNISLVLDTRDPFFL